MRGEWCYISEYFSSDFCDSILEKIDKKSFQKSNIGVYGDTLNQNYRESEITWLFEESNWDISNEIWKVQRKVNLDWFDFHIDSCENYQISKYSGDVKGHYDEHIDVFWLNPETKHRKLSMVIQLSDENDYEGGNLIIRTGNQDPDPQLMRKKGTVIFFPSFIPHKVEPVISGDRYSLVTWFTGPKWR